MKQRLFRWVASLRILFLGSLCALTLNIALPVPVSAADLGVYVTPKFVYGYTFMDKLKGTVEVVNNYSLVYKREKTDDAWGGALAVGYNFDKRFQVPLRAELEYSLFSRVDGTVSWTDIDPVGNDYTRIQQKLDIQTLFLNAYFDIKTGTPVTPYIGAGIGTAFIDARTSGYNSFGNGGPGDLITSGSRGARSNTNLAWNVGAGAGWDITECLTLDLGYRFASLGEAKGKTFFGEDSAGNPVNLSGKTDNLYMHQVMLGLRFNF